MRIVRLVLLAALTASVIVGIQILLTDFWLWSAAPTHAYELIVFVALDAVLILGTLRATRLAIFGAMLTATIQLVAMVSDIIAGQPAGLLVTVFRNYLLTDLAYLGLLTTQSLIIAIAIGTWVLPRLHGHWLASLKTVEK